MAEDTILEDNDTKGASACDTWHDNETLKEAMAFLTRATKADQEQHYEDAFLYYKKASHLMFSIFSQVSDAECRNTLYQQIKTSTTRLMELKSLLEIEYPVSDEMLAARCTAQRLLSPLIHPVQQPSWDEGSSSATAAAAFATLAGPSAPGWRSALIHGPSGSGKRRLCRAVAASVAAMETAEWLDASCLDAAAAAADAPPNRLMAALMERPGLLWLRRIDRLLLPPPPPPSQPSASGADDDAADTGDAAAESGQRRHQQLLTTELLVRVHALRCQRQSLASGGRSRLLATARSAELLPAAMRRKLFDVQLAV